MGLEIERKFLVDADPATWPSTLTADRAWAIRQGYLTAPGVDPEIRIRHARPVDPAGRPGSTIVDPDVRRLTTKAASGTDGGGAVSRIEVEIDLDASTFDELWQVTDGRRIEKVRSAYELPDGSELTVDRFGGRLDGLALAEIEFADAAASQAFEPPAFLGAEVSADRRYRNAALAGADGPPVADEPAAGGTSFLLAADEPLGEGLRRAAREQLDGAAVALDARFARDPGKAIHDARKRLKRTRALLRLARPALGADVARRENAALRDAATTLSAARDADVMLQTLDALAARDAGRLPAATFAAARASLGGTAGPREVPSVDAALTAIRAAAGRVDDWPLTATTASELLAGERRAYAAGHGRLPRSGDRPTADDLHEWRKRVKDLWYHGQLLQNAWSPVLGAQAEEAHRLSELLGDDHDLAVLRDRLVAGPLDDPTADVDGLLALIDRRRTALLDEALDLGSRVYAETPKAHTKRLRRLVRAWRAAPTA